MTVQRNTKTVIVLLLIVDGKLLLQKRSVKDAVEGMWAPIAGKVDEFESPTQAVIREAMEETGIVIDARDLTLVCTAHWADLRGIDVVEFYFKATRYGGTPAILEPHKASAIRFYPLTQLPENTVTSLPRVFSALEKGEHYLEWRGAF